MWEGKVFAAADADADAAETDWKHKVTPERGDLIMATRLKCPISVGQVQIRLEIVSSY